MHIKKILTRSFFISFMVYNNSQPVKQLPDIGDMLEFICRNAQTVPKLFKEL